MTKHVIILHLHELTLKGNNRSWFEKILIKNLTNHLKKLPHKEISIIYGRVLITNINVDMIEDYRESLSCVLGIRNFIFAIQVNLDIEKIKDSSLTLFSNIDKANSFRVSSRRQNKNYKFNSQEINCIVGEYIQINTGLKVNLSNPDVDLIIEIVNNKVFIGTEKVRAYGGLPVGTGEQALSLISSGIDSPVASFNILKRGVKLDYIHFHSAPATSNQSIYNVESLLKVLCKYQLQCSLYLFPLLNIQNKIMDTIDSKFWVLLFRRAMIKISNIVAINNNYKVLISGENIGQVASQTLSNIVATQDASSIPIIRPLSGYNKEEIVNQAEEIGTYKISIEPYQDCCSYFVPPNPETKAKLERLRLQEQKVNLDKIIETEISKLEKKEITLHE